MLLFAPAPSRQPCIVWIPNESDLAEKSEQWTFWYLLGWLRSGDVTPDVQGAWKGWNRQTMVRSFRYMRSIYVYERCEFEIDRPLDVVSSPQREQLLPFYH
jgi:hypothetical protein